MDLVVVDEAHHAVAPSYRAIFERFRLLAPDTPRMLVGFTATLRRGDRQGFGEVFEEIPYSRSLEEMIRERSASVTSDVVRRRVLGCLRYGSHCGCVNLFARR